MRIKCEAHVNYRLDSIHFHVGICIHICFFVSTHACEKILDIDINHELCNCFVGILLDHIIRTALLGNNPILIYKT